MPPQDKAELSRPAFMAGTNQERLEAPEDAFPFHAPAKAQPYSRAPPEAAVKGRAPQKVEGRAGTASQPFQRLKG